MDDSEPERLLSPHLCHVTFEDGELAILTDAMAHYEHLCRQVQAGGNSALIGQLLDPPTIDVHLDITAGIRRSLGHTGEAALHDAELAATDNHAIEFALEPVAHGSACTYGIDEYVIVWNALIRFKQRWQNLHEQTDPSIALFIEQIECIQAKVDAAALPNEGDLVFLRSRYFRSYATI